MANVTDLANVAAAQAAGYKTTQTDRGNPPPSGLRFRTVFNRTAVGAPGDGDGPLFSAVGESSVDQATADAAALASLNAQRRHYFGGSPGRTSGAGCPQSAAGRGGAHTIDTT